MKPSIALSLLLIAGAAQAADYPAPVQALVDQGIKIDAEFKTPAGLTGYGGWYQGRPVILYLAPSGEHVIVGSMLDAQGKNITADQVAEHLPEPAFDEIWPELEKAAWVREGDADAKRVVYVFTDPNCGFCHAFWKATQPYLGKDLQVRHLMVAALNQDSLHKSARILASKDPAAALAEHERLQEKGGGIEPLTEIPPEIQDKIAANNQLMMALGAEATPTVVYKDRDGRVRRVVGMPSPETLADEIVQQPRK